MKIDKASLLGIIGTAIVIVGVFLPWATSSSPGGNLEGGLTYWSESGWNNFSSTSGEYYLVKAAIILGIVSTIAIIIKKIISVAGALIIGLAVLAILIYIYLNLNDEASLINSYHISDWSAGVGYGIWVSIIGSIALIAGGVLAVMGLKKVPSKNTQPSMQAQPK